MSILCLTGWQQPADALAVVAPNGVHFDYGAFTDMETMFAALPKTPKLAIGWSLGGQLLVRAIAAGHIRPEALLLLGAPYQWLGDEHFPGFPREGVKDISADYQANAQAMLKNLNALIALGDSREKQIIQALNAKINVWPNGLFWLGELAAASCMRLDFSGFPKTTIVHGQKDKVIYPHNAELLAKHITGSELLLWPQCAHAPHLHDTDALRAIVGKHV